jgi:hypothetical protein
MRIRLRAIDAKPSRHGALSAPHPLGLGPPAHRERAGSQTLDALGLQAYRNIVNGNFSGFVALSSKR